MEGLIREIKRYEAEIIEMEFQNNKNRILRIVLREELQKLKKRKKELENI